MGMEKASLGKTIALLPAGGAGRQDAVSAVSKSEALRKSLHFLVALSPALTFAGVPFAVMSLLAGVVFYTLMELLRLSGRRVPVVSALTMMVSRERGVRRFELGPVTLGLGAALALLLFPLPAATVGILAAAFGDGFAGLVGRLLGRVRPAFLFGKSVEGSLACLAATAIAVYLFTRSPAVALTAAVVATIAEALPLEDYDNIALPLVVALAAQGLLAA